MTQAARFKQSDVARAVKGAESAGMRVGRIEITRDGKIVLLSERSAPKPLPNDWDDVLQ